MGARANPSRAQHHQGMREDLDGLLLAHPEADVGDVAALGDDEVAQEVVGVRAPFRRGLAQGPADEALVLLAAELDEKDVVPRGPLELLQRLGLELPPLLGVLEPLDEGPGPAVEGPLGEVHAQPGVVSRVGIAVRGDPDAAAGGAFDEVEEHRVLPPVRRAADLEVGDLERQARRFSDVDGLGRRLDDQSVLAPHVGRVESAVAGGDLGQLDDLLDRGEAARRVFEAGRQPERPLLHRRRDESLHPLELRPPSARDAPRSSPGRGSSPGRRGWPSWR